MNHSLYSADRPTHFKIVAVALISATLVAGIGIAARVSGPDGLIEARMPVIKAGAPVAISDSETRAIRCSDANRSQPPSPLRASRRASFFRDGAAPLPQAFR